MSLRFAWPCDCITLPLHSSPSAFFRLACPQATPVPLPLPLQQTLQQQYLTNKNELKKTQPRGWLAGCGQRVQTRMEIIRTIPYSSLVSHHCPRVWSDGRQPSLHSCPITPRRRQRFLPPFRCSDFLRRRVRICTPVLLRVHRLIVSFRAAGSAVRGLSTRSLARLEVREAGADRRGSREGGQEATSKHRARLVGGGGRHALGGCRGACWLQRLAAASEKKTSKTIFLRMKHSSSAAGDWGGQPLVCPLFS